MTLGNPVASTVISAEPLGYLFLIEVSVTYYKTYKFTNSGLQTLMIYLERAELSVNIASRSVGLKWSLVRLVQLK